MTEEHPKRHLVAVLAEGNPPTVLFETDVPRRESSGGLRPMVRYSRRSAGSVNQIAAAGGTPTAYCRAELALPAVGDADGSAWRLAVVLAFRDAGAVMTLVRQLEDIGADLMEPAEVCPCRSMTGRPRCGTARRAREHRPRPSPRRSRRNHRSDRPDTCLWPGWPYVPDRATG